jgi:hypothetical protein
MVDDGIFIKNADIQAEAGVNANATSKAVAATDVYVLKVEAAINVATMYNWSDKYATLNADVKGILADVGAMICATKVIRSDTSGYTSRDEAIVMMNSLNNDINRELMILRDIEKQRFIKNA